MKAKLRNSLLELLEQKSFANITIDNIVDRAHVGKGSFYRYFKNKNDLLLFAFKLFHIEYIGELKKQKNKLDKPFQRLLKSFELYFDFCLSQKSIQRLFLTIQSEPELINNQFRYRHIFTNMIEDVLIKIKIKDSIAQAQSILILSMLHQISFHEAQHGKSPAMRIAFRSMLQKL